MTSPKQRKRETPAKVGRPPLYSEELADIICEKIALGSNLHRICAEEGMPGNTAVYRWRQKYPEFEEKYARAKEFRADNRCDKIDALLEKVEKGEIDPQAAKVILDGWKWQAGHENPKRYSPRLQSEISGPNGGPIKTQVTTDEQSAKFDRYLSDRMSSLRGPAG